MTYQVLARKWRPQDFASLIGQQPIVTALTNALAEGRIAQAYLFSGIRGVGKTTAARLLAKALNCEQGPTATPCNVCTTCREITSGADLDVIEVDAATYSKVEQVRELTESLRYGSARDRYKVVVLDEIHRLSRQAFDALLKIVEEPPPHLVFVFATTEAEAVPATILSRCQEFHFRRVPSDELTRHLRTICEAEGIRASDSSLRLIARAGEGSVRDSVALLDQLATFGAGGIEDDDAARLLGGLDTALLRDLLAAIVGGDGVAVARLARRLEDEGWDPRSVYGQFLAYSRDALHLALAGGAAGGGAALGGSAVDLPEEDAAALAELAAEAGYENLLRLLQQLLAGEPIVRRSENGYIAAEIAWLRAAELPKLVRVEELLGGGPGGRPRAAAGGGGRSAAAAGSKAADRPPPADSGREAVADEADGPDDASAPAGGSNAANQAATSAPASASDSQPGAEESRRTEADRSSATPGGAPAPPAAAGPSTTPDEPPAAAPPAPAADPAALAASLLAGVRRVKPPLAARLETAGELSVEGDRLLIRYASDDDDLRERLDSPRNRETLDQVVTATLGPGSRWQARGDLPPAASNGAGATAAGDGGAAAPPPQVAEHPTVQTVLQLFDGRIEAVEADEPFEADEEAADPVAAQREEKA